MLHWKGEGSQFWALPYSLLTRIHVIGTICIYYCRINPHLSHVINPLPSHCVRVIFSHSTIAGNGKAHWWYNCIPSHSSNFVPCKASHGLEGQSFFGGNFPWELLISSFPSLPCPALPWVGQFPPLHWMSANWLLFRLLVFPDQSCRYFLSGASEGRTMFYLTVSFDGEGWRTLRTFQTEMLFHLLQLSNAPTWGTVQ